MRPPHPARPRGRRRLLTSAVLLAVAGVVAVLVGWAGTAAGLPAARPATVGSAVRPAAAAHATGAPRCTTPAPRSAAAFARGLASVPAARWGAADLSVSVPMPDGRSVWLYGDTMTGRDSAHLTGFVHSSAIVVDRGCFGVSGGGRAVLPDDSRTRISWLSAGLALDATHLLVSTGQQQLTGSCPFCFRQVGTRGAVLSVSAAGDVRFQRWIPGWPRLSAGIAWDAGLARDSTTAVLYGMSTRGLLRDLYVATAPLSGALTGHGWRLGSRPVARGVDPAGISAWSDAHGWHLLTLRGTAVVRLDGPGPAGPFTEHLLGRLPPAAAGQLRYRAAAHPEARLADGGLLVTVCTNWIDGAARRLAAYRPQYLALG